MKRNDSKFRNLEKYHKKGSILINTRVIILEICKTCILTHLYVVMHCVTGAIVVVRLRKVGVVLRWVLQSGFCKVGVAIQIQRK